MEVYGGEQGKSSSHFIIPDGGNSGEKDVDAIDQSGDGVVSPPQSNLDYFPPPIGNGDKVPGQDVACPTITVTKDKCGRLKTSQDWSGCLWRRLPP